MTFFIQWHLKIDYLPKSAERINSSYSRIEASSRGHRKHTKVTWEIAGNQNENL